MRVGGSDGQRACLMPLSFLPLTSLSPRFSQISTCCPPPPSCLHARILVPAPAHGLARRVRRARRRRYFFRLCARLAPRRHRARGMAQRAEGSRRLDCGPGAAASAGTRRRSRFPPAPRPHEPTWLVAPASLAASALSGTSSLSSLSPTLGAQAHAHPLARACAPNEDKTYLSTDASRE
ncbi:hypothetical protein DMC30DRAFT_28713 [Rhodotorula diobovata]|uniref:Uncharacterized protein n=1 Tax=Rhodotorula diobovata TaxID=5288 RepID=A0A5C5FQ78_9BASI|nr:hypothetical protein DMC30DRAFT_28713 [Rhodotorula diobovata]